jgi:uncharacterized protein (TIGR02594 family)
MTPIELALSEYGNEAWPNTATNPDVLKYFTETGYQFIHDDETPWCAAFLNWILLKCKRKTENKLNARSFLTLSKPTQNPTLGDIVVLWRISPSSWQGHCGLFVKQNSKLVWILGGNQDSRVCIQAFSKTQLLGYRTMPPETENVV